MKTHKVSVGFILMLIGIALIITAFGIVSYNLAEEYRAGKSAENKLAQLNVMSVAVHSDDEVQTSTSYLTDRENMELSDNTTPVTIPDYVIDPTRKMPVQSIDGNDYIAVIEIQALELALPVMSDWSYEKLKQSPCRYSGSAYTNDLIIAAHNYSTHFGAIRNLQIGDKVTLTDIDNNLFSYQVVEIETLSGLDVDLMKDGEWDLTLFTCTVGGKSRVTIRCSLV